MALLGPAVALAACSLRPYPLSGNLSGQVATVATGPYFIGPAGAAGVPGGFSESACQAGFRSSAPNRMLPSLEHLPCLQ